jgi:hypothetical protein
VSIVPGRAGRWAASAPAARPAEAGFPLPDVGETDTLSEEKQAHALSPTDGNTIGLGDGGRSMQEIAGFSHEDGRTRAIAFMI